MELKKNENMCIAKFRTLFINAGLVITLVLTITAFEWKWEELKIVIPQTEIDDTIDVFEIKNTKQDLPKAPIPPKPESKIDLRQPVIETIKQEVKKDEFKPTEVNISALITATSIPDEKVDVAIYKDFEVEDKAVPIIEYKNWYKSIANYCEGNLKERDKMYKGKVWLSFIIEKNGVISNIEVLQSVHKRVDAVAIRAIKESGKWKPAKMGVRNVRQRMKVPISFK